MPKGNGRSRQTPAIFTLASAAVSGLVAVAVKGTGALFVVLIVVGAILLVFSLTLWYQVYTDSRAKTARKVDLRPNRLVASLSGQQREFLRLALSGAVNDVANVVGMKAELVRANMFARIPRSQRLAMVKDAFYHMNRPQECTIEMDVGKGCAGRAFDSGDAIRAIWKDGWGPNDIGEDDQLAKVHPELRWILSVPIPPASDPKPALVLSVDGLGQTPSREKLSDALSHLFRYGQGIGRTLAL